MGAIILKNYPTQLNGMPLIDLWVEVSSFTCDRVNVTGFAKSYESVNNSKNPARVLDSFPLSVVPYSSSTHPEQSLLAHYRAEKIAEGRTIVDVV